MKPSPDPENCKLKIGNICYFAVIHDKRDVNYDNAVDICKKRNADVGLTWDKESYNAIMKYLSSNVPTGKTWINIWTGIKFDPMIGDVTSEDPFIEWYPNNPNTGIKYKDRTNVYLYVKVDPNYNQGMGNGPPTWERHGVICEILI
ncbi:uncharacterized protein LOC144425892 [Styela clava]